MMKHLRPTLVIAILMSLFGAELADAQLGNRFGAGNIVHVAKSGKGFRSIQAALDSISDASEDNPYLVSVAPGVYEERVSMKPFVDIEGAGENLTKITSSGGTLFGGYSGSRLSSLTVECIADSQGGCAAINEPPQVISRVTIRAVAGSAVGMSTCAYGYSELKNVAFELISTGGAEDTCGTLRDQYCAVSGPYLYMENVSTWVPDLGCFAGAWLGGATIRHSTLGGVGGYGLKMDSVEVHGEVYLGKVSVIRHSVVHGPVHLGYWSPEARISHSQVDGEFVSNGEGEFYCFSVHDADLNPLDENCQPIQ